MRAMLVGASLLLACLPVHAQGFALLFDGIDDRVTIPDSTGDLDLGSQLTLEAWVKPDAISDWIGPVLQGDYNDSGITSWGLWLGGEQWVCVIMTGPTGYFYGVGSVTLGEWHHLACTYDGTTIRTYQDGQPVGSQEHPSGGPTLPVARAVLGHNWPDAHLEGTSDQVSVWSVVRSADQIELDSLGCIDEGSPGLIGLWRLDDYDQQLVVDSSGNNNHGWLGLDDNVEDRDPQWVISEAPFHCVIFIDGFESGDTSAWSNTTP